MSDMSGPYFSSFSLPENGHSSALSSSSPVLGNGYNGYNTNFANLSGFGTTGPSYMGSLSNGMSSSPSSSYQQASGSSYFNPYMQLQSLAAAAASSPTLARALATVQQTQKRPRSEKKPIPAEQKDDKYFERRKRNNYAAKKSRDARKAREDEIAIRASFLEKENAILRAQVATLREEANSLKQLLLQKRSRH